MIFLTLSYLPPSPFGEGRGGALSYLGSPPFGGVGGGFTTSYAASSAHKLTVLPSVHQVGLLQRDTCLPHQNSS